MTARSDVLTCVQVHGSGRRTGAESSEVLTVTGASAVGFVVVSSAMLLLMFFFLNKAFFVVLVILPCLIMAISCILWMLCMSICALVSRCDVIWMVNALPYVPKLCF